MAEASGIHDEELAAPPGSLTLPRWFLVLMAAVASLFGVTYLPWSIWVTWTLITLDNAAVNRFNDAVNNRDRIVRLEESRENHALQLQAISATRFTAEQANVLNQSTLSEIREVAKDVQALQRDFDRTIGKGKPE